MATTPAISGSLAAISQRQLSPCPCGRCRKLPRHPAWSAPQGYTVVPAYQPRCVSKAVYCHNIPPVLGFTVFHGWPYSSELRSFLVRPEYMLLCSARAPSIAAPDAGGIAPLANSHIRQVAKARFRRARRQTDRSVRLDKLTGVSRPGPSSRRPECLPAATSRPRPGNGRPSPRRAPCPANRRCRGAHRSRDSRIVEGARDGQRLGGASACEIVIALQPHHPS